MFCSRSSSAQTSVLCTRGDRHQPGQRLQERKHPSVGPGPGRQCGMFTSQQTIWSIKILDCDSHVDVFLVLSWWTRSTYQKAWSMRQRSCCVLWSAGSLTVRSACASSRVVLENLANHRWDHHSAVWNCWRGLGFLRSSRRYLIVSFLLVFIRSVVVSLRLLPKLFGTFQQFGSSYDTHWITM